MIINICNHTPALGVMLKVVEYPVHLVEPAFLIFMLDSELIPVGLADRALFIRPGVPYFAV